MVAYSFNRNFVAAIAGGRKRQTIRAPRRRHVRVGEQLQLYTGMRTRHCQLIRDDVVCTALGEVFFDLRSLSTVAMPRDAAELAAVVASYDLPLIVNGIPLSPAERDVFACDDGFDFWLLDERDPLAPFAAMVLFWMSNHGAGLFEGVLIRWEPVR